MTEASFASLNSALLARKGGAKPAMRPQLTNLPDAGKPANLEDLGWNDMGAEEETENQASSANVVHLSPAEPNDADAEEHEWDENADTPDVLRQQEELATRIEGEAAEASAAVPAKKSSKPAKKRKSAKASGSSSGRRAAFTLRLDTDRHLKLRLAATMQGKSAQAVVTEALDAMLEQIDDLDTLAQKMKRD